MGKRKLWQDLLFADADPDEDAEIDAIKDSGLSDEVKQEAGKELPDLKKPLFVSNYWVDRVKLGLGNIYARLPMATNHHFVVHSGCAGSGLPMLALKAR